ncbi:hypothetical protein Taro_020450 [Colocasia esculenta]|uniref:Uncharacterized protein n=1 Tax=Colocasia esculenta TaxID=4460 RepID=A0A843UWA0_COLES|nr:hypothetical protein [Colocasia esculenta]
MKGVEVEEFRDVEVYPDEELFVVVVRKNFKLCLDSKICICRQMQTDLQKAEDWASREIVSCVDLSTDDLVLSTND